MKTTKILLILLLTGSFSSVFGQVETTNQKGIKENGISKQTQGATFGERKGWDGSIKGNKIEIVSTEDGIAVIFPNGIAYKTKPANGSFVQVEAGMVSKNRMAGTPIGGIIVKGGKNPGGQMRGIDKKDIRFYELPADWTDGSYLVQISYEPDNEEMTTTTEVTPSNNLRGKTKGKIVKAGGNFFLEKQGTNYAISSVSSLSGTGGGAAAASYAKTVQ
ncbi:MAG: hypothetical protein JZU47_22645 [Prolixibacteraceae bacterium]|nr:hypothetical protein [Prolixibacteraceae bacterium]